MSIKIFDAQVHFVTGKGGVGKTLISEALAQFFGKRCKTLLISLSEEEAGDDHRQSALIKRIPNKNYFYTKIFPDQTLYEYLSLKIPQKKILDSFMSQTLFRALSTAMPGLADLTRLGKIWFHADKEHEPKGEIFEKIVVDMPSSGFVGRFLNIARVVREAVRIGPLAKEASLIEEYFKAEEHARLHAVALPEELVVNETIELVNEIKRVNSMHLGYLFLNRIFEETIPSSENMGKEVVKVVNFFTARKLAENALRARLAKSISLPMMTFPDFIGEVNEDNIVRHMSALMSHGQSQ